MYIEQITTPYDRRFECSASKPLTEAIGVVDAIDYMRHAPDYNTAMLEVVEHIQEQVSTALFYPEDPKDALGRRSDTPLDTLVAHQQTNCIGYTCVASEALSFVGITHYIGYVNRHFTILVPAFGSGTNPSRLYTFDMLSPRLNQEVSNALRSGTPDTIAQALTTQPNQSHAVILRTDILAANLGKDIDTLSDRHPWLSMQRGASIRADDIKVTGHEDSRPQYRCLMNIYAAQAGREVIEHYVQFRRDVALGRTATALVQLEGLRGRYPEIDCRASHDEIRTLVGYLCTNNTLRHRAPDAIAAYCDSLDVTGDSRAYALRGFLLRMVARADKNMIIGHAAAAAYRRAANTSRFPNFSAACENIARTIESPFTSRDTG